MSYRLVLFWHIRLRRSSTKAKFLQGRGFPTNGVKGVYHHEALEDITWMKRSEVQYGLHWPEEERSRWDTLNGDISRA